jgi:hypothetical protein
MLLEGTGMVESRELYIAIQPCAFERRRGYDTAGEGTSTSSLCEHDVERSFRETCHYQVARISINPILSWAAGHLPGSPSSF